VKANNAEGPSFVPIVCLIQARVHSLFFTPVPLLRTAGKPRQLIGSDGAMALP
jgi:hypothetical protein